VSIFNDEQLIENINMDIRKLQYLIVDALEDVKGQDIDVFDTTGLTSLFDRVIVASGTSNRQTRALASSVREKIKEAGGYIGNVEGEETGEWVLVDAGDAVVHIMQPVIRQYYRLEEIWGGKNVDAKKQYKAFQTEGSPDKPPARKAPKRKAMKTHTASEAMRYEVSTPEISPTKPPVKFAASKKAGAKKPAARKAATGAAPAKKVATKAPAKRIPTKLPAARTAAKKVYVGGSKAAAPKPRTAAKTATKPASKTTAKKAPAKRR
jgi:ribosome-associated protein